MCQHLRNGCFIFPYKYHRKADDVNLLWDLFESIDDLSKITPQLFQDILSIHSVGFQNLHKGLFWYAPDLYLPIDGQTVPYLSDITFPQAYKVKIKRLTVSHGKNIRHA